jgi:uncharacterized protein YodC (DUF2158 family)
MQRQGRRDDAAPRPFVRFGRASPQKSHEIGGLADKSGGPPMEIGEASRWTKAIVQGDVRVSWRNGDSLESSAPFEMRPHAR